MSLQPLSIFSGSDVPFVGRYLSVDHERASRTKSTPLIFIWSSLVDYGALVLTNGIVVILGKFCLSVYLSVKLVGD